MKYTCNLSHPTINAKNLKKLLLKPGKEQSLKRFHPWVFSGALETMQETPTEGEFVQVYSRANECLGTGHFQTGSIAVRMVSFTGEEPSDSFWKAKIEKSLQLRVRAGLFGDGNTNVFRLINAEGDGFSGLIADYYNGTVVFQAHSPGFHRIIDQLSGVLKQVLGDRLTAVYDKSPVSVRAVVGEGEVTSQGSGGTMVLENGLKFKVDWAGGQKTGFFIDQRESRKLLEYYSPGRSVLNMFSYTGGFSVYALRGGASLVHTVDSSSRAIELATENIGLNFPGDTRNRSFCTEAFDYFKMSGQQYDIIVLDPPAFAKSRRSQNNALQAYKRLNSKAMEFVAPGGILFTFSCSQVVSRENFRQAIYSAALQSGREIRILHQLSHCADHPVSIYHPEGEYLKGLVLQVV
jgi:23S rRNA (cytosine1962-C5)-methyltransferase